MAAKIFEVNDVLPAGQIKISWDFTDKPIAGDDTFYIKGTDGVDNYFIGIDEFGIINLTIFGVVIDDRDLIGNVIITLDNEVTITEFGSDGKDYYTYIDGALFWEEVVPSSGYSITFEENGGTSVTDLSGQIALPNPLPTTSKSGYTFGGWYYESNFQTRAKAGDTIEANTTLYAKWLTLAQVLEHIHNVVEELRSAIIDKGGDAEGKLLIDFAPIINSLKTYEVVETLAELELLEPTLNRIVFVVEGSGELAMGAPVKVTQDGDTLIIG